MLGLGLSSNDVKLCPTSLPHLYCCFSLNVVVVVFFFRVWRGVGRRAIMFEFMYYGLLRSLHCQDLRFLDSSRLPFALGCCFEA